MVRKTTENGSFYHEPPLHRGGGGGGGGAGNLLSDECWAVQNFFASEPPSCRRTRAFAPKSAAAAADKIVPFFRAASTQPTPLRDPRNVGF
jgi:hypothetical protein